MTQSTITPKFNRPGLNYLSENNTKDNIKILEGDKFLCIKDFIDENGTTCFYKDKVYKSLAKDCLVNELGEDHFGMEKYLDEYFKKVSNNYNLELNNRVNHPSHYIWLKEKCGIEAIDITREFNFNLGNALKYILRSGNKEEMGYTIKQKQIEDLKKAIWYLNDEIKRLEK